jgi:hypothetical protein
MSWPVEFDGHEYQPIPKSWIEHLESYYRQQRGGPRLFAVSAAAITGKTLRIRYLHSKNPGVLVCQTAAREHNGGPVPEALVNCTGWPHSLHPGQSEPKDVRRDCEAEHFEVLWSDRLERPDESESTEHDRELVADGGTSIDNSMHPKRTGSSLEAAVIDPNTGIEFVPDTRAEWHDAVTTSLLTPSVERPFVGICVVETGTPVEIKGTIPEQSNGDSNTAGRWFVKRASHERLLKERGVYWLCVYAPSPLTPILAERIVPASIMDELLAGSWYDNGRREVAKLSWTTLIDREEVGDCAE